MKAVGFFSGGKDSVMALILAKQSGVNVSHLIMDLFDFPRPSPHQINLDFVKSIANLMDIPLTMERLHKGQEVQILRDALKRLGAEAMVAGDIAVEEHKKWYSDLCEPLKVKVILPLWATPGRKTMDILLDELHAGIKPVIAHVDGKYLPRSMVGEVIDEAMAPDLAALCDPCGENGEYHSLVLESPLMAGMLSINDYEVLNVDGHYIMSIKKFEVKRS